MRKIILLLVVFVLAFASITSHAASISSPPATGVVAKRCTTACDIGGLAIRNSALIYKSGTESRNTTTTLTADTDLQWTNPTGGDYFVEGCLRFSASTVAGMGIKIAYNRGSAGSSVAALFYNAVIAGAYSGPGRLASPSSPASASFTAASIATSGSDFYCFSGYSVVQGGISYRIEWAQNTSDASNLNVLGGSWMMITRLN